MTPQVKLYAGLAAAAAAATLAIGGFTYVNGLRSDLAAAKVEATTQHGVATVATGQSAAHVSAAAIADQGVRRDQLTITLHEDHANAIASAPGAAAPVDPGLVTTVRRGLCEYAAYADDPGCAGLRGHDPAELPPAG